MDTFRLTSQAFKEGQSIPSKYTCDGDNISPPLHWEGIPENTRSFVLIVDDPDAPNKVWSHWVVYQIPPGARDFKEGMPPEGCVEGLNDFKEIGYGGPCPPSGTHRYFFKLYALSESPSLPQGATKQQVEKAIAPYIISHTELIGTYKRR